MAQKMATVERVEELLEKLRAASWDHAVKGTINLIIVLLSVVYFFWTCGESCLLSCISSFASLVLRFLLTYLGFVHGSRTLPILSQFL
jgi:uncharacterized protein YacL